VDTSYDPDPPQDIILRAMSISRQWSVQNLYGYALDHLNRRFESNRIHPAIVLGVAREYGISSLIRPAVRALSEPDRSLASWSADPEIIRHMSVMDIGVISRMKERLSTIRAALCTPPPEIHDQDTCQAAGRAMCSVFWRSFWVSEVVPRILASNGKVASRLCVVRDGIEGARVLGMMERCANKTIAGAIDKPGWRAEWNIIDGAVDLLVVAERVMLPADDGMRMVEESS